MTVALAGRAPATFEIKSANLPLVSLLLKSADLRALAAELKARFGDIPDFFDNDPLVIDLSPLAGPERGADRLRRAAGAAAQLPRAAGRRAGRHARADGGGAAGRPRARAGCRACAQRAAWIADQRSASDSPRRRPPPRPKQHSPGAWSSTGRCARASRSTRAAATWSCWPWSTPAPRSSPTATSTSTRRCAARPSPARAATPRRASSRCAWKPELISIAGVYRTSEVPLPADVAGQARAGAAGRRRRGQAGDGRLSRINHKDSTHGKNHRRHLRQGRGRQDHHQRQLRLGPGPAPATRPP